MFRNVPEQIGKRWRVVDLETETVVADYASECAAIDAIVAMLRADSAMRMRQMGLLRSASR